jgi:hypothetical protein
MPDPSSIDTVIEFLKQAFASKEALFHAGAYGAGTAVSAYGSKKVKKRMHKLELYKTMYLKGHILDRPTVGNLGMLEMKYGPPIVYRTGANFLNSYLSPSGNGQGNPVSTDKSQFS